jgi:hypothetical protein
LSNPPAPPVLPDKSRKSPAKAEFVPAFFFYDMESNAIVKVDDKGNARHFPVDFKNNKPPSKPAVFIEGNTVYLAGGQRG